MMGIEDDMPVGLGFELGLNPEAMRGFSSLSEDEKRQVIEAARGIRSKDEMDSFVNSIAEVGRGI